MNIFEAALDMTLEEFSEAVANSIFSNGNHTSARVAIPPYEPQFVQNPTLLNTPPVTLSQQQQAYSARLDAMRASVVAPQFAHPSSSGQHLVSSMSSTTLHHLAPSFLTTTVGHPYQGYPAMPSVAPQFAHPPTGYIPTAPSYTAPSRYSGLMYPAAPVVPPHMVQCSPIGRPTSSSMAPATGRYPASSMYPAIPVASLPTARAPSHAQAQLFRSTRPGMDSPRPRMQLPATVQPISFGNGRNAIRISTPAHTLPPKPVSASSKPRNSKRPDISASVSQARSPQPIEEVSRIPPPVCKQPQQVGNGPPVIIDLVSDQDPAMSSIPASPPPMQKKIDWNLKGFSFTSTDGSLNNLSWFDWVRHEQKFESDMLHRMSIIKFHQTIPGLTQTQGEKLRMWQLIEKLKEKDRKEALEYEARRLRDAGRKRREKEKAARIQAAKEKLEADEKAKEARRVADVLAETARKKAVRQAKKSQKKAEQEALIAQYAPSVKRKREDSVTDSRPTPQSSSPKRQKLNQAEKPDLAARKQTLWFGTLDSLKTICKNRNYKGFTKLRKERLIDFILEKEGYDMSPPPPPTSEDDVSEAGDRINQNSEEGFMEMENSDIEAQADENGMEMEAPVDENGMTLDALIEEAFANDEEEEEEDIVPEEEESELSEEE